MRSVNHFGDNQQKMNRNKSVYGRELKNGELNKSIKPNYQLPKKSGNQPLSTDRRSFIQNTTYAHERINKGKSIKEEMIKMKTDQEEDKIL